MVTQNLHRHTKGTFKQEAFSSLRIALLLPTDTSCLDNPLMYLDSLLSLVAASVAQCKVEKILIQDPCRFVCLFVFLP